MPLSNVTVSTAGTRVPLSGVELLVSSIIVQALPSNSGSIFIGDSSVTSSKGIVLTAGSAVEIQADSYEGDSDFSVIDVAGIYIDASANGDGVAISYLDELSKNLNL